MTIYRATFQIHDNGYHSVGIASLETPESLHKMADDLCEDQMWQDASWYDHRASETERKPRQKWYWDEFLSCGHPDYFDYDGCNGLRDALRKRGVYLRDLRITPKRPFVFYFVSIGPA